MKYSNRKKGPQGPRRPKQQFFEFYSDPDPRTLPRFERDHLLRKCARHAAIHGETFAEYKAVWEGRRDQEWWLRRYHDRPDSEPHFTDEEVAFAYADALQREAVSSLVRSLREAF